MSEPTNPTDQDTPPAGGTIPPVKVGLPATSTQLVEQDPEIDFRRRYDQLRGTLQAALSQWDQVHGQLTAEIQRLQASQVELGRAQTTLNTYTAERETTKTRLQELEAQASQAAKLVADNEKLQAVLRYPQIVNAAKIVTGDNGQAKQVNPFLDLVLSSSLQGDMFSQMLAQVAEQIGASAVTPPQTPATPTNPAEMLTAPPAPGETSSLADLTRRAEEAMNAGEYQLFYQLQDQIVELQSKS